MKYIITIGITLIILSLFAVYNIITTPSIKTGVVVVENELEVIKNELLTSEDLGETYDTWNFKPSEKQKKEEELQQQLKARYTRPESAVHYLFATALLEDMTLFADSFIGKTYTEDLFTDSNPNKIEVTHDIMRRLTQDGKVEKIDVVRSGWASGNKRGKIIFDIYYADETSPIRSNVVVTRVPEANDFYFIESSVWSIIQTIERERR